MRFAMNSNKLRLLMFLMCVFIIGMLCPNLLQLQSYSTVPKMFSGYFFKQKKPCTCQKCLQAGDEALAVKISSSPAPFLSNGSSISRGDFEWWKRMQHEKRNMAYFNTVVKKLFEIIPPSPPYEKASVESRSTCAVVGNSGNLKGSQFGELIDSHDIVIRINRGPTKGYEEDVGTKTTHHVAFPASAINLPNTTYLVLITFKIEDLQWLLTNFKPDENTNKDLHRTVNKDLVMVLNPAFMRYVHEKWLQKKGWYPSTGFMTLIFSLTMCDEVNVFGFGLDKNGNLNHYYDLDTKIILDNHDFTKEHQVIELLVEKQKIKLFKAL